MGVGWMKNFEIVNAVFSRDKTGNLIKLVNTYGKNGYIKLGSELSGGNIITPYLTSIARDSAFLVSLNAIAYSSVVNEKDNNQLTVNILSGGEFLDGKTSNTFNLNFPFLSSKVLRMHHLASLSLLLAIPLQSQPLVRQVSRIS